MFTGLCVLSAVAHYSAVSHIWRRLMYACIQPVYVILLLCMYVHKLFVLWEGCYGNTNRPAMVVN